MQSRRTLLAASLATAFSSAVLLAFLLAAPMASAETATWPDKPVRTVVPFPPGGAADIFARLVGQKYTELWGGEQAVVIDNRAGAGGVIGSDVAAKSPADGYTLLMVTVGHALNSYVYTKLPYDTKKDFTPIGVIANLPSLVIVAPSSPSATLKDFMARAKANPGKVTFASSGAGTTSHVGAALMESMGGVDRVHVPYKGAAPALQDVMGERVDMSVDIILSSLPLVQSGKLKALAVTSPKRSPLLPNMPTVTEAGLPGYDFMSWYVLVAPAGTPAPILEKLNEDLRKIAAMPDVHARIEGMGGVVASTSLKEVRDQLNGEFDRWARVARERNIKVE
jgi:tripartite-type tricarboxylate transporter receptor subunit TctC